MSTKPQLVLTQDLGGANNSDLNGSRARLTKGGSWKRQRIATIIPSSDMMAAKVALSLWNLAYPPNNGSVKILALGQEVGEAYSNAVAQCLACEIKDWEYLLTIEHDNIPPSDGILKLLERMEEHPEFAVISGLYFTKGPGGVAQIWGDPKDPVVNYRPQLPDLNGGLVECCGTGMGFALWRMSMFKDERLRRPWFKTQTEGGLGTQDLYFAGDARKYGYRFAVDCSVKVGHYDLKGDFGIPDYVW